MKICILNSRSLDFPTGDVAQVLYVTKGLAKLGFQIDFVTIGRGGIDALLPIIRTYSAPYFKTSLANFLMLRKIALQLKIDIDYFDSTLSAIMPQFTLTARNAIKSSDLVLIEGRAILTSPVLYAKREGKPVIYHSFGSLTFGLARAIHEVAPFLRTIAIVRLALTMIMENLMYGFVDKVLIHHKEKDFVQRLFKIPENKVVEMVDVVDTDTFKPYPSHVRERFGIRDDEFLMVYVGNLHAAPNFYEVKYIFERLMPKLTDINACFLQVGPRPRNLFMKTKGRSIFAGKVKDVAEYINAADLCIFPKTLGGAANVKILEYMACGKPVLTTPLGVEALGVSGKEVMISELDCFPEMVRLLAQDRRLREEMGRNARAFVREKHSLEVGIRIIENAIKEVVAQA